MAKQTEHNVGIYMRLSKDDERAGESLSIENQKLILTKYVMEQGWNLVSEYVDDGWSGTDFDRPGVQRLLEDAQTGKINTIVVKDLSRFGRNYIEVGRYVDYIFPSYNIRFIALNDHVDTAEKDTSAMDMMPIVNLFNEWHSANTSKKIKAVFTANAKAGKYKCTYAAYGYEKGGADGKTPVIDEYAASIVRRIFEMRAMGYNPKQIADVLNAEKVLTPSDYRYHKLGKTNPHYTCHLWGNQNIKQILHNPIYLGNLAQLRTTTVSHKNHKVIQKDESDWAVVEGTHEPIITQELWDKCREVDRSVSKGKRPKIGDVKPLSGFLYCADCGAKMRLNNGNKYGTKPAYTCGMYARAGKQYCGSHYIKLYLIEDIILSDIRSMIGLTVDEDNARQIFLKRKLGVQEKQTAADTKKLREIEKRLAELDMLIQSVYEDKVIGKIPEEVCVNLLGKYQQEKTVLQTKMQELTERAETEKQDERDVDEFIKRLKKYAGAEQLTREMCFELIEYVTVGKLTKDKGIPREIHIYYKFLDKGLTNKLNALL